MWRPPRGIVGVCAASWREPQPQVCRLVYHSRSAAFLPGPLLRNFPFAPSFVPPSFPRSDEIFLPPSVCFVSPKSQRDSRWGVVGYDLRAGCDVRRGSQRCVGRGARGAVPGMDWAWSWACRTSTGEWMRMGSARRADRRTGGRARGRADRSLGCSRGRKERYSCCGWEGRVVADSTSSVWEQWRRRRRQRRSRKQATEVDGGED